MTMKMRVSGKLCRCSTDASAYGDNTNPLVTIPRRSEGLQGDYGIVPKQDRPKFGLSYVPEAADKHLATGDQADPEPR